MNPSESLSLVMSAVDALLHLTARLEHDSLRRQRGEDGREPEKGNYFLVALYYHHRANPTLRGHTTIRPAVIYEMSKAETKHAEHIRLDGECWDEGRQTWDGSATRAIVSGVFTPWLAEVEWRAGQDVKPLVFIAPESQTEVPAGKISTLGPLSKMILNEKPTNISPLAGPPPANPVSQA